MYKIINIFIGGSIDKNTSNNYINFAEMLASKIMERDYQIIFDGCNGLPSIVFDKITGFDKATICYTEHYRSSYILENNNFQNKAKIYRSLQLKNQSEMTDTIIELSDAFIFMKGKLGTLEEVFRVVNGRKNHEHDKPIVIVNINHEWDDLISLLGDCRVNEHYYVTDNVMDCLNYIEQELYHSASLFYRLYVENRYIERLNPIIEKEDLKRTL